MTLIDLTRDIDLVYQYFNKSRLSYVSLLYSRVYQFFSQFFSISFKILLTSEALTHKRCY